MVLIPSEGYCLLEKHNNFINIVIFFSLIMAFNAFRYVYQLSMFLNFPENMEDTSYFFTLTGRSRIRTNEKSAEHRN